MEQPAVRGKHLSAPPQTLCWHPCADRQTLLERARSIILAAAAQAIAERGAFNIVLAGGETPRALYASLCKAATDWSKWHAYFGDERCLPPADAARNSRMAGEAWFDRVAIPAAQVHAIPAELGAEAAATAYAQTLRSVGEFDLVLLGLGEDGHTASLFPGDELGDEDGSPDTLPVHGAPKPPAERVSLSAARLSRTRRMLFIVSGEQKRRAVRDWHARKAIPASMLRPATAIDVLVDADLLPASAG